MKYIKTVTVTPLREDRTICTLMANDKYKDCTFENGLSTGYFPAPMVVEVWQTEDSETADDSATEFVKYLRGGRVQINPVEGVNADKSLKRTNWDFNYQIPDYEQMVAEMAEWIYKHKELYPHYNL